MSKENIKKHHPTLGLVVFLEHDYSPTWYPRFISELPIDQSSKYAPPYKNLNQGGILNTCISAPRIFNHNWCRSQL